MIIAKIKLASGQVGFYDEISGIHLTLTETEANVEQGTNTAGLLNGVSCGKIVVTEGSLGKDSHGISDESTIPAIPSYYRLLEKKKQAELKERLMRDLSIVKTVAEEEFKKAKNITEVATKEAVKEVKKEAVAIEATAKKVSKKIENKVESIKNKEMAQESDEVAKKEIKPEAKVEVKVEEAK